MSPHQHGPHLTAAGRQRRRLELVLAITLAVLATELVGAVVTGGLVLLADAGHLATDAAGVGLTLLAVWVASRPATPRRTFGYQRVEILAAVANALLLFAVGGYVIYEAVRRLVEPPPVAGGLMVVFGVIALVGNLSALLVLRHGQAQSLPVRAAFLEVLADTVGAAMVILAALVVSLTGFERADSLAAVAIGLLIIPRTWRLLRDSLNVLLESTPSGVDLDHVRQHILATPGVLDVHDLHAWTITSGMPVLSAHIVLAEDQSPAYGPVLDRLTDCLAGHFDVEHCTFQLEPAGHADHESAVHHH